MGGVLRFTKRMLDLDLKPFVLIQGIFTPPGAEIEGIRRDMDRPLIEPTTRNNCGGGIRSQSLRTNPGDDAELSSLLLLERFLTITADDVISEFG